ISTAPSPRIESSGRISGPGDHSGFDRRVQPQAASLPTTILILRHRGLGAYAVLAGDAAVWTSHWPMQKNPLCCPQENRVKSMGAPWAILLCRNHLITAYMLAIYP